MRRYLLKYISGIMLTLILLSSSALSWSQTFSNSIRQGLIKVKFKTSMSETVTRMQITSHAGAISTGITKVDATAKAVGASGMYRLFPYDAANESKLRKHGLDLWYVVEISASTDPRTAVMQFKQLSEIEIAEVEREKSIAPYNVVEYKPGAATLSALPFNDPYLKDQWHYNNTGQTGFSGMDINLFKAWESTTGANDVIVSVHDEGVDVKHEDLKGNIWVNAGEIPNNGIDDDHNGYIDDVNGFNFSKNKGAVDPQYHGTHVAGTIAAVNNNGKGVSGVAGGDGSGNGAKIMSLQILGGGLIERSYVYAANNGAVISQNSWGYASEGYFDQSVIDAIKYFVAEAGNYPGSPMRGGVVIFAAGNSNSEGYWYPSRYASILSVSSLGPEGKRAPYSNYGSWVEISAPGGDQINYSSVNGVLSTIPGNKYSYIQGTSMACPHVSGVAALVLANRTTQLTSAELWSKLLTGVASTDVQNPEFINKLGTGAIDAALAIKSDAKLAPETITDLVVDGVAQEFATLSWTVPADEDDRQPVNFSLYYQTSPITSQNLSSATKVVIKNSQDAGSKFSFEVSDILGLTTYYFAVTSSDRWGNTSLISNRTSASTNVGPSISVVPGSIDIEINANESTSNTSAFDLINSADGILRWQSFMRHRSLTVASGFSQLQYPAAPINLSSTRNVGRTNSKNVKALLPEIATTSSFTPTTKNFADFPTNIVGETNTSIPNSAAGRFYVTEDAGFNLTDVSMYLKHDPAKGPVIVEIFRGESLLKNNLVYAQEYSSFNDQETWASVILDEQLYFEKGSTFWVVFHIPSDNLYPLGIGFENQSEASTNCFMSFNVGATWQPLEEALNTKEFAWAMAAGSYNQFLGTYLTLDPEDGDVSGNSQVSVSLTADASQLVNGTYSANVVIASNDAVQREIKIPVNVIVEGHRADIRHIDIADFGSVFIGDNKTFDIVLDNQGYGNLTDVGENGGNGGLGANSVMR
jgi:subtilisin family serine protease